MRKWGNWRLFSEGRVRKVYENQAGDRVMLVAGDSVSSFGPEFDMELKGRGIILTKISKHWFDDTSRLVPNAYEMAKEHSEESSFMHQQWGTPVERVTEMVKLNMVPINAIVYEYLVGDIWEAYVAGERNIGGIELPEGLINSEKLPKPVFVPTTKTSAEEQSETLDFPQVVSILDKMGVDETELLAEIIRETALLLFGYASERLMKKGIIMADSKFEFGFQPGSNRLILADELFTPDSSRFWSSNKYRPGQEQVSLTHETIYNALTS